MERQGVGDHTNELEDYRRELISLLPWLGPHITKHSNQGSVLQIVEHAAPITMMTDEDFPWSILEGEMEFHTDTT